MRVLVVGYYQHSNLGDELFVEAFRYLFPEIAFVFTDQITQQHLAGIDAIFLGGGSFLGEPLKTQIPLSDLQKYPLFYIGVGTETDLHPSHQFLLSLAKLVAIRTNANYERQLGINPNTIVIPDLVYALPNSFWRVDKTPNSILFLPNINTVPDWKEPHYKHAGWDFFKNEVAQALDVLLEQGWNIDFFPMSAEPRRNDEYAAAEIINRMTIRKPQILQETILPKVLALFASYQLIITQRYHGAVLADLAYVPSITIHHHDKLKTTFGAHLPFYGLSKGDLLQKINDAPKEFNSLPIDWQSFETLQKMVKASL